MSILPKIQSATFSIKTSELKKAVQLRPMNVSEHKAIQQANDIYSLDDTMTTIGKVTSACSDGKINPHDTPLYLLEYMFLRLYMSSVDNVISSIYKCNAVLKTEDGKDQVDEETGDLIHCNTDINVKVNLDGAKIVYPKDYNTLKEIKVDENTVIELKSISLDASKDIDNVREQLNNLRVDLEKYTQEKDEEKIKITKLLIKETIDTIQATYIYHSLSSIKSNGDEIDLSELTIEETFEWYKKCPSKVAVDFDNFFSSVPYLGMDIKLTCPNCGNKTEVKLMGIGSFL